MLLYLVTFNLARALVDPHLLGQTLLDGLPTAAQLPMQMHTHRASPMAAPYPSSRRQSVDSTASLSHGSTGTSGTPVLTPPPLTPLAAPTMLPPAMLQDADDRDNDSGTEKRRAERRHGCWMCHKAFDR